MPPSIVETAPPPIAWLTIKGIGQRVFAMLNCNGLCLLTTPTVTDDASSRYDGRAILIVVMCTAVSYLASSRLNTNTLRRDLAMTIDSRCVATFAERTSARRVSEPAPHLRRPREGLRSPFSSEFPCL